MKLIDFILNGKRSEHGASTMKKLTSILFLASIISACSNSDFGDLHMFVDNAYKDIKPRIEPLPQIKPSIGFSYTASDLDDPFSASNLARRDAIISSGLSPNINRRKESLEHYPLDSLRMVGTLSQNGKWGVVEAPDGTVHRITEGNHMGQNFGKITRVDEGKIDLVELIQDPNGSWIERAISVSVKE